VLARIVSNDVLVRGYRMADGDDNGRFKQAIPNEEFVPGPLDEASEVDDAGVGDDEAIDAVDEEGEEDEDESEDDDETVEEI
jgi:hypothetical protein